MLVSCLPATGQELPASWRMRVAKATSTELAEGFLFARYKQLAAMQAREDDKKTFLISLDAPTIKINSANAESLSRVFQAQLDSFTEHISERGYPNLPEAFFLETAGDCSQFGFTRGAALLTQDEFKIELWQNGVRHPGAVVESGIAFEHGKSPEIRLRGELTDTSISLKLRSIGFAQAAQEPDCSLQLIPVQQIGPEFGAAYLDRAVALLDQDHYEQASADLDRAIELNPQLAEAWYLRSQLRSVSPVGKFHNGKLAVEDARRACELTDWNHWQCLAPLACAYAEAGDFNEAIKTMEKAVPLAPRDKQKLLSEAIEKFRQKKPLRYPLHTNMPGEPIADPDWVSLPERPNVSMQVFDETNSTAGNLFQVKTSGLPSQSRYQLWMKGLLDDWTMLPDTGIIKTDGVLAIQRAGSTAPFIVGLAGFQKGESSTLVLVSEDRQYKVTFKFIPRPLATYDATSGYGLEAELLDPQGNFYLLTVRGFDDEQGVKWYATQASSNEEALLGELDLKSESGQPQNILLATAVYGKSGDILLLRFVGKKGELRLEIPWGDRLK